MCEKDLKMKLFKCVSVRGDFEWKTYKVKFNQFEAKGLQPYLVKELGKQELPDDYYLALFKLIQPIKDIDCVNVDLINPLHDAYNKEIEDECYNLFKRHHDLFGATSEALFDVAIDMEGEKTFLMNQLSRIGEMWELYNARKNGIYTKEQMDIFNQKIGEGFNSPMYLRFKGRKEGWQVGFNDHIRWGWFTMIQSSYGISVARCDWCNQAMLNKRADAKTCSDACRKQLSLKNKEK